MKKLNNKGFSLVELIIVIAIMAVLVGVLAPQYLKYVEKSRIQTDESAIGEIRNIIVNSMADDDVYPSVATGTTVSVSATAGIVSSNSTLQQAICSSTNGSKTDNSFSLVSTKYKGSTITFTVSYDATEMNWSVTKLDKALGKS